MPVDLRPRQRLPVNEARVTFPDADGFAADADGFAADADGFAADADGFAADADGFAADADGFAAARRYGAALSGMICTRR